LQFSFQYAQLTLSPHSPVHQKATHNLGQTSTSTALAVLVGKSARISAEFHDYFDSGPFELLNFHRNFIFPIIKCVPANSEHVPAGSESSPANDSSDCMNRKTFPPFYFEMAATGVE
jgi:hypothetical protein